jgi:hypothetical protein
VVIFHGASRKLSTSFCNPGDSRSIRPGIASKKLRSATIGASTQRRPTSS